MVSGIRVLEVITPSRIGGAEVFAANLCEEFPRLGAQVELFCPSGRPFLGYARSRGAECISWKTRGKLDPVTVLKLVRLARERRVDVIHTHLSTASLLGAFAARLAGKPSVAHVHGLNTATCFRFSDTVIAVSEAVKRHLCAQGIDEGKVRVVHNGIDPARFAPIPADEARASLGYDPHSPIFGVFGRLSSEKGQRTALEAMFLIRLELPNARLVLAGDGRDRVDLEAAAEALGVGQNVVFTGFVQDVRQVMSACDAVVVPSMREGFGLAAVEAMALERPVVASDTGGLSEVVVHAETGFLVPPGNPQVLAESLIELCRNRALARDMGGRGRERVRERFDLRKQMEAVFSVLQAAVSQQMG